MELWSIQLVVGHEILLGCDCDYHSAQEEGETVGTWAQTHFVNMA